MNNPGGSQKFNFSASSNTREEHNSIDMHGDHGMRRWWYSAVVVLIVAIVAVIAAFHVENNVAKSSGMSFVALTKPAPPTRLSPGNNAILRKAESSVPSATAEFKVLKQSGVSLSVDGSAVGLMPLASHVVGFWDEFIANTIDNAQHSGISSRTALGTVNPHVAERALQDAVSYEALATLAWQASQNDGQEVSLAAAKTYAENQYKTYQTQSAAGKGQLPSPLPFGAGSPKEAFLSSEAVQAYRMMMSISAQFTAIAGPSATNPKTGVPVNRTPALASWMSKMIAGRLDASYVSSKRRTGNIVVVTNVPGVSASNIATMLPPDL